MGAVGHQSNICLYKDEIGTNLYKNTMINKKIIPEYHAAVRGAFGWQHHALGSVWSVIDG